MFNEPQNDQPSRRGRPTNAEIEARQAAEVPAAEAPASSRVQETHARRRRRDDSGETLNRKLFIPERFKDPNYEYRWINDTASGRIQEKTVFDDWDVVKAEDMGKEYAQAAAAKDKGDSTQIRRVVGSENGHPLYAYLCRKPKEFHEEDQLKKQRAIQETEDAMRRGALGSGQGISRDESYVPKDHRNVIGGR